MLKQEKIPEVITACCVLHNFILDNENLEDVLSDPEVEVQVDEGEPEQPAGPVNVRGAEKRREISFML
ncbi:hypothetical protein DPMN_108700 [Dreissena polymorpha]|uniref:Uncharacterized protein n=1 Tax=Dreissena polymorpha TaxID=45954 RepID=A0A9D4QLG7_DREPO|nr:hypothetical protein DPMN_108700 [Dreissena polymorpha]